MNKITRILFVLLTLALLALAGTGCTAKAKKAYHLSRADHFYAAGQLGQAEIEYLNVLRYDQANTRAFSRLGLIYYDQGRLQRALFFLAKGIQLTPDDLELRVKAGFIYSSVGQFTQAVAQANFVLGKNPKDDEAPILLVEGSVQPKDAQVVRQKLETMARTADHATVEVALGNLALREHDLPTASAAYKKAQALDPKSPAVNVGLASAAWAQGDLKQAEAFFKAAADASPSRSPRRMEYARFKIQTGDINGARAMLADLYKTVPDYLPVSMMLAEIAANEKKYDECAEWLDKVLALDEDNFDGLFFQGQLDEVRGQPDKAVIVMERMARVYPQVPQVHYQLGLAYMSVNDFTKAADSFDRALELNPNYVEATVSLAQIQLKNNNPSPAIIALERVRQKQPRLVQAQLLLADAYRLQNRASDALAIYGTLESMYPTNEQVRLLHGAALLQLQDKAGARKAFEQVLQLAPENLPAIGQMVDLDISETNFTAGLQLINDRIQKNPKQAALRIMAAKIYLAQGKRNQAETILNEALGIDPDSQGAYLLLAQLYSEAGENEKALAKVNAAMARDPKNSSALMLAARIYEANKDYKGAAEAYEKVLKLDPKYSPALNNLAYIYSEYLNNVDRAYDLAQRARDLLPFDPSTADTLGWVCFRKGSYQSALGLLKESAAKLPADPEVQFHLGMACYMTGDEASARPALQWAWQNSPNFSGRDECARCLAILDINPATADAAAQSMLEKRVSEKADDPVALARLARIYQRAGNAGKAATAYEALLQALPKNLDAMANLVRLYSVTDTNKAYEMAKNAGKVAPYDPEVLHTLGRLAFVAGDYQVAASTLQQALKSQPNNAQLLFDYAQAAYSIGRVSQAQAALQGALAANLSGAQATQAQRILDMIGLAAAPAQAAAASPRIGDILKSETEDVPALMARAAASEFQSNAATAEQCLEKVLGHYPDFIPAQKELARLYAAEPAKLDRAYTLAAKLHDTQPDDPEGAKTLAIILVQRGDYSHAVGLLKQSAVKLNSDAEVFYYLGTAQFRLKNRTDSKASLQQAIALKLSGPALDSAKQMLTELK